MVLIYIHLEYSIVKNDSEFLEAHDSIVLESLLRSNP